MFVPVIHGQLHCAFWGAVLISGRIRCVRLRINFCSRSKRELSGHDDCFVGLNSTFDDHEIAVLPLPGFYRTKIDCVVRLQHKYERSTLANLHCLRWNQPRVFDRVENETDAHEFRSAKMRGPDLALLRALSPFPSRAGRRCR